MDLANSCFESLVEIRTLSRYKMYLQRIFNPVIASMATGTIMFFINGCTLTWSSPVIPKLQDPVESPFGYSVSDDDVVWIVSIIFLGGVIGSFLYGFLADEIGRKYTYLFLGVPVFFSFVLMAYVNTVKAYYLGRFLAGLPLGGSITVATLCGGEIPNKDTRSIYNAICCVVYSFGYLFPYAVGPWISVTTLNTILAGICAVFIVVYYICGEETAYYYALKNDEAMARSTLERLRNRVEIEQELMEIKTRIKEEKEGSLWDNMMSKKVAKCFVITVGLIFFQQFCGINRLAIYTQTIFEMTGSNLEPEVSSVILASVSFATTLPMIFLAEKWGRKSILVSSALGTAVFQILLGVYCYLQDHQVDVGAFKYVPLITLALVVFSFNQGLGPCPFLLMAEVFPTRVRAFSCSIVTALMWCFVFVDSFFTTDLVDSVGLGQSFWIYAGVCFVATVFVKFVVLETKGKTMEEIQIALSQRKT